MNEKQFVIKIRGKLIPVSQEVYLGYYRAARHEKYLEEKDTRHSVLHFSQLDTEELIGEDAIPDLDAEPIEDIALRRVLIGKLRECIDLLTDLERELVEMLFFSNGGAGMTERDYTNISGIPQKTINDRKLKIFAKLRKMFESEK